MEKILYLVYTEKGYQYEVPFYVSENYTEAANTWEKMAARGKLVFLKSEVITDCDRLQEKIEEAAHMMETMKLYGVI
jgi:hypothetical protein